MRAPHAEKIVATVRCGVMLAATLPLLWVLDRPDADSKLAFSVLLVAWTYTLVLLVSERARRFLVARFPYASSLFDGILATLFVYATGGVQSPYVVLFYTNAVAVSLRFGLRPTLVAATLYCLIFFAIAWSDAGDMSDWATLVINDSMIFMSSLLAGSLSQEVCLQAKSKKDEAEAANRVKSEFLATMSHEIRTPMTAIVGFTDLLQNDNVPFEKRREYIQIIQRNGQHLLALIDDILDLSKVEAGKLIIRKVRFSLVSELAEIVNLMKGEAQKKNVAMRLVYTDPVPEWIESDPLRLRQVMVNLISNSIKFTDNGSVTIFVGMERPPTRPGEEVGPECLAFTISDTGCGIHPTMIERLFRPFTQLDSSMTRRHGGTGLGLALTSRLVAALGGKIELIGTTLGEGTTFKLWIDPGPIDDVRFVTPDQPAAGTAI